MILKYHTDKSFIGIKTNRPELYDWCTTLLTYPFSLILQNLILQQISVQWYNASKGMKSKLTGRYNTTTYKLLYSYGGFNNKHF